MKLRTIIVDDERLARADLHYMLKNLSQIESVTECADATQALAVLHDDIFDAMFLDIEMPGLDGLKAVKIINQLSNPPMIVFVTAYDEHAAKAFELNAVDYLVKPFNNRRLAQAVEKLAAQAERRGHNQANSASKLQNKAAPEKAALKKIPVEKGDGILLINLADVHFIQALDDKIYIHTFNEQYLYRASLNELESKLSQQGFVRVHRSYIANLHHVLELQPFLNGTYNLIVDDQKHTTIPVSRQRVKQLKAVLGV